MLIVGIIVGVVALVALIIFMVIRRIGRINDGEPVWRPFKKEVKCANCGHTFFTRLLAKTYKCPKCGHEGEC